MDLKKTTIVINGGHGGRDPGAIGIEIEKDLNLKVALKLKDRLEKHDDFNIFMTRDSDSTVSLHDRTTYANNIKANLYYSIHHNSAPESVKARGYEVIHSAFSIGGKKLAEIICNEFSKYNKPHRGPFTRLNSKGQDYYHEIRATEMISVITEYEYVQNKFNLEEEVDAHYNAILKFYDVKNKNKNQKIIFNGSQINLDTTMINNYNFIKLRDIEKLGFTIDYDEKTNTVYLQN